VLGRNLVLDSERGGFSGDTECVGSDGAELAEEWGPSKMGDGLV